MEMLGNIFEGFEYYIVILDPIFYDKFFFDIKSFEWIGILSEN
jgi:hypothetical protein